MNFSLSSVALPVRLRLEHPFTDFELAGFCAVNEPLRVEREANGELIIMSPTVSDGGLLEAEVLVELAIWARQDGRGKCFGANAGFTLQDTSMRAADAAWLSLPRWNALSPDQQSSFAPVCPEFVIEIRSKSDSLIDLQTKMRMWVQNGAELAWLIDPKRKTVEVYRLNEEPEIFDHPTSVQGTGPVRGFELVLSQVWG